MYHKLKVFVAGHRGLVGSAIVENLRNKGYENIITAGRDALDLRRQKETENFFAEHKPDIVYLCAAKVGGILANSTYKAEFIYDNISIAANVIHASHLSGVRKLLNLGSSCIYPKFASQPIKEDALLTGPLEPTNEPYAVANIAAIKLCQYYNEQYGTDYLSVMPTNLFGCNDNFGLLNSHVLPALIRKCHLAKHLMQRDMDVVRHDLAFNNALYNDSPGIASADNEKLLDILSGFGITKNTDGGSTLHVWGTGTPFREFMFVDDLADACTFIMEKYASRDIGEFVNVGTGVDMRISELISIIKDIVKFEGVIAYDHTKPDGTPKKQLDTTKLHSLGWSAKTDIGHAIARVYKAYQKRTMS
jgi:GDP-L-fucose synthase